MSARVEPRHRELGLTDDEYERICARLERDPNDFELTVFSLLWSEHCGYKHSALFLRRFPTEGDAVLQGPGENAGVVSIGDGLAVAFKVESHNHPSAVEPYEGAGTGVGGILRDIVAMGARPIALLDSLRFGSLGHAHQRWLFRRAVAGIGTYGNCVGVPNLGGECFFDRAYEANCLVNAMCVGLLPEDRVTRSRARGPGNRIVLYGASTGRDGIGGASVLASKELSEGDTDKRPTVQIGDPFNGKKLIEASMELVERGLVASLQDLGAAGLASSLSEMAASGGSGVDVALDRVPLREPGMPATEIMVSESQERMVAVVESDRLEDVLAVCRRWELECADIGQVTDTGVLRCSYQAAEVGAIPARILTDAPRYAVQRRPRRPRRAARPAGRRATPEELLEVLASPNVASRAWVYSQYDQLVQSRTARRPGLDAGLLRLRPGYRGLAVSLDGAGRLAAVEPRAGGALAVFEAARNVACAGGRPLAMTNCLNFGNPEKPEVAWELEQVVEGMAEACETLGVPIVSGNVSLYNETDGVAIYPTPVVGCIGLVDDVRVVGSRWREGDVVIVAGQPELSLSGSEYGALFLGGGGGEGTSPSLEGEAALVSFLWKEAASLSVAHDSSDGGLAIALVECALAAGVGAVLEHSWDALELFGEGGGQAVVACPPEELDSLMAGPLPTRVLGEVGGTRLLDADLAALAAAHDGGLRAALEQV